MATAAITTLHQAGVIAYRFVHDETRVLLITSRDTGRWIIPRGNIAGHRSPADAAAKEAFEEAGVRGVIASHVPLGFYPYFKKLRSGETVAAMVEVYLMRVTNRLKQWPEKGERKLSWLSPEEAITVIQEPGAVPLLRRFAELLHCGSDVEGTRGDLMWPSASRRWVGPPKLQSRP